jgi:GNAT superfamily N-acetyltransferase
MTIIRIAEPYDLSLIMTFDLFPGDRITEIVDRRMLVAELDNIIVGYVAWQHGGCIGKDYVNKLVVDQRHYRRGIAQALIGALNTVLTGRVFISTGERNTGAVALLQGTGWTPAGEIVGLLPMEEPELFFYRDL